MTKIVLDEASHKYTVDGIEVPSVSELVRFISKEVYKDILQSILDNAADRGTRIHKATQNLDSFGEVEVDDEISGYVKAYVKFIKDYKPSWEKIEFPVNNGYLYAGTIDRYGLLNDEKVILDIKSTSKITKGHKVIYTAAQNLYRLAMNSLGFDVKKLFILQLKKEGSYELIELEIEDKLAEACINLHYALAKKRKKKEEKHD